MTTNCPHCQSPRVVSKNIAKKTCGYLGLVGGAASGIAGAFLGALVGAAAGGIAGAQLGEVIDETVLDNHECLDCGHEFSLDRR